MVWKCEAKDFEKVFVLEYIDFLKVLRFLFLRLFLVPMPLQVCGRTQKISQSPFALPFRMDRQ